VQADAEHIINNHHHQHLYVFRVNLGHPVPFSFPPPSICSERESLGIKQVARVFHGPGVLSVIQPTVSKHEALSSSHWSGIILSSSITRLLTEGALIPLRPHSDK